MTLPTSPPAPMPAPDPGHVDDVAVARAIHLALHGPGAVPAVGRPLTSAEITRAATVMARQGCSRESITRATVAWRLDQRRHCARCSVDFVVSPVQRQRLDSGVFACDPCAGDAR